MKQVLVLCISLPLMFLAGVCMIGVCIFSYLAEQIEKWADI